MKRQGRKERALHSATCALIDEAARHAEESPFNDLVIDLLEDALLVAKIAADAIPEGPMAAPTKRRAAR